MSPGILNCVLAYFGQLLCDPQLHACIVVFAFHGVTITLIIYCHYYTLTYLPGTQSTPYGVIYCYDKLTLLSVLVSLISKPVFTTVGAIVVTMYALHALQLAYAA